MSVGGLGLSRGFSRGHKALIVYLMAGYPDRARSLEAVRAAAAAGADIIELGVPYADPIADGPVIVKAAEAAREAAEGKFGLMETLQLAADFSRAPGVDEPPPIALMTYLNPMIRLGLPNVAQIAREAGVSGFIMPDMPPEAADRWLAATRVPGEPPLDTVFLVAPTSTDERLTKVGALSSGFVYCVSTTGVTGERNELPPDLAPLVERVRAHTEMPVAVGFGIGRPEQAAAVAKLADGVIVGSAAVRRQGDSEELGRFVAELRGAVG